ncbi:MAG: TerC family protein [Bacteroidetes bacterium]|nr:TerC family protein [Bacteroidota bacterium]
MEIFTHPATWISLLTLTFLEIVLGVDNIIFISLVANKLPQHQRKQARNVGLVVALGVRLVLLMCLSYIIGLTQPLFHLPIENILKEMGSAEPEASAAVSFKDLILILGGFFLIYKSTSEIHEKVEGKHHEQKTNAATAAFSTVIFQIVMVDVVFSFDSILTAIGLTQHITVMMAAVVISMLVMMQFSTAISAIINKYPTLQMLALSFLILIGFTLIMEGLDIHINKGFVYVAVLFSLIVEFINIRMRKRNLTD